MSQHFYLNQGNLMISLKRLRLSSILFVLASSYKVRSYLTKKRPITMKEKKMLTRLPPPRREPWVRQRSNGSWIIFLDHKEDILIDKSHHLVTMIALLVMKWLFMPPFLPLVPLSSDINENAIPGQVLAENQRKIVLDDPGGLHPHLGICSSNERWKDI